MNSKLSQGDTPAELGRLPSGQLVGHLTAIIASSDDAILSKNLDGIILSWNQGAERIFGYTAGEAVGQSVTMLMPPDRVNEEPAILQRIRNGERVDHFETVRKRKDGALIEISLSVSPIKNAAGEIVGASKIARDITTKKQADRAHGHFRALVEFSDDAILSKDLYGVIQSWNKGAERIFGYTAEEIIGQSVIMLIPEGKRNEEPGILARIREGQRVDHYETIRRRKDGTLIDVSLSVSPIKDETGRIVGASKIARDISERKATEAALHQARYDLEQLNRTLQERIEERTENLNRAMVQMQEFSYCVSHDLRAPIRAMEGYASVILEDHASELSAEVREYLSRIMHGSQRMDRLIADVLIYSRLTQGKITTKPIALESFVKDLMDGIPSMAGAQAAVRIESPLLNVMGDESLLSQVIMNLLNNALKFIQPGVASAITISTERIDGEVQVWVKDNGIGIDPIHQGRLFRMFERIHEDGRFQGTGIGLAIVRKAVEKMDGTVGMTSRASGGSAFWFKLRAAD